MWLCTPARMYLEVPLPLKGRIGDRPTILPLHSFPPLLSCHPFLVSKHAATTECCTAYFNQRLAKRRVRYQANSHRSLMQRARCLENSSKETIAVRNAYPPENKYRQPSYPHYTTYTRSSLRYTYQIALPISMRDGKLPLSQVL